MEQEKIDCLDWSKPAVLTAEDFQKMFGVVIEHENKQTRKVKKEMDWCATRTFQKLKERHGPCQCEEIDGVKCESETCLNRATRLECPSSCGRSCRNQAFKKNTFKTKFRLIHCEGRGFGLASMEAIEEEDFVLEFTGQILLTDQSYKSLYACNMKCALTKEGKRLTIEPANRGGIMRYVNSSHAPNLEMFTFCACDGTLRNVLVALQNIAKGVELLWNYGENYWDGNKMCDCGAPQCPNFNAGSSLMLQSTRLQGLSLLSDAIHSDESSGNSSDESIHSPEDKRIKLTTNASSCGDSPISPSTSEDSSDENWSPPGGNKNIPCHPCSRTRRKRQGRRRPGVDDNGDSVVAVVPDANAHPLSPSRSTINTVPEMDGYDSSCSSSGIEESAPPAHNLWSNDAWYLSHLIEVSKPSDTTPSDQCCSSSEATNLVFSAVHMGGSTIAANPILCDNLLGLIMNGSTNKYESANSSSVAADNGLEESITSVVHVEEETTPPSSTPCSNEKLDMGVGGDPEGTQIAVTLLAFSIQEQTDNGCPDGVEIVPSSSASFNENLNNSATGAFPVEKETTPPSIHCSYKETLDLVVIGNPDYSHLGSSPIASPSASSFENHDEPEVDAAIPHNYTDDASKGNLNESALQGDQMDVDSQPFNSIHDVEVDLTDSTFIDVPAENVISFTLTQISEAPDENAAHFALDDDSESAPDAREDTNKENESIAVTCIDFTRAGFSSSSETSASAPPLPYRGGRSIQLPTSKSPTEKKKRGRPPVDPRVCVEHGRQFKKKNEYDRHMLREHGIGKKFKCKEKGCKRSFVLKGDLTIHADTHKPRDERDLVICPFCRKDFTRGATFNAHLKGCKDPDKDKADNNDKNEPDKSSDN